MFIVRGVISTICVCHSTQANCNVLYVCIIIFIQFWSYTWMEEIWMQSANTAQHVRFKYNIMGGRTYEIWWANNVDASTCAVIPFRHTEEKIHPFSSFILSMNIILFFSLIRISELNEQTVLSSGYFIENILNISSGKFDRT